MTEEQNPREQPRRNIPRNLKQYFLVLLTRGERWNKIDDNEAAELLPRHLGYLRSRIEEDLYVVAGPVNEESAFVGMVIINAPTKAAAAAIAAKDPGVIAGRLGYEIHAVYLPSLSGVNVQY